MNYLNYIPKYLTPSYPISWLPNFDNIQTSQQVNKKAEERRLQAKKDAGIVTDNDVQDAEIEARKQKAKKEGKYFSKISQIYSQPIPILGNLDEVLELAVYFAPGLSTIKFADDGSKAAQALIQDIKYGQVAPAIGHAILVPSSVVLGVASLIPGVGLVREVRNSIRTGANKRLALKELKNAIAREMAEKSAAKTAANHTRVIIEQPEVPSTGLYRASDVSHQAPISSEGGPKPQTTSFDFYERPKSKLTEAEKLGTSKGERNNIKKNGIPVSNEFLSPDIPTQTLHSSNTIYPVLVNPFGDLDLATKLETAMNFFEKSNIEILPEFKTQPYILAAKNYYANLGINLSKFSDDAIARMITLNYKVLSEGLSGILKNKVLWHGSVSNDLNTLDASKSGLYTGNKGLYGTGFYFTNYPNAYGQRVYRSKFSGNKIYINNSLPFLVNDISEIAGNPKGHNNSYGLVWHLPEGNITIPYSKAYNRYYYPKENEFGIPEGHHWTRYKKDGSTEIAPQEFKGYNLQKSYFDDFGNLVIADNGTGYKVALGNNSWMLKKPGRAFLSRQTITDTGGLSKLLIPEFIQNGITYPATEIVVPYSTSTKSLFPHPDVLIKSEDGTFKIMRNWADKRINYKQGGSLNYLNYIK